MARSNTIDQFATTGDLPQKYNNGSVRYREALLHSGIWKALGEDVKNFVILFEKRREDNSPHTWKAHLD